MKDLPCLIYIYIFFLVVNKSQLNESNGHVVAATDRLILPPYKRAISDFCAARAREKPDNAG